LATVTIVLCHLGNIATNLDVCTARKKTKDTAKHFMFESKMASAPIPVDFVIGNNQFAVLTSTPFVTIAVNNTLFPIQPVNGQLILVAQTFPSALNGVYQVTGTQPGGVIAVRLTDVPYTRGTRFILPFGQVYVVLSNVNGEILIRLFNPNDPTQELI
jgi:hypothetical protein